MTSEKLRKFILDYTDAVWNQHDPGAMDRYYAPAYVHHDVSRPDVTTLEDYRQWAVDLLAGLSEFYVDVDDVIVEEDKAVKRWTATGIHSAELAEIKPTGKRVSFSGTSTYRMQDDRIAESWYVYDLFGLLGQLGALPA